jgi:hypothetical protein
MAVGGSELLVYATKQVRGLGVRGSTLEVQAQGVTRHEGKAGPAGYIVQAHGWDICDMGRGAVGCRHMLLWVDQGRNLQTLV